MLDRQDIHNAAMLQPDKTKCLSLAKKGRHAYIKTANGTIQCVDCGEHPLTRSPK